MILQQIVFGLFLAALCAVAIGAAAYSIKRDDAEKNGKTQNTPRT